MPEIPLTALVIVAAVAFAVPLALGLAPRLRLPSVVVEILAGIVLGPSLLGVVDVDDAVAVLALLGLAFLLFLAGLEVDVERLRGPLLRRTGGGFGVTLVLSLAAGFALAAAGAVTAPLLVAIILTSTSLGIVIPVLKDAGRSASRFGQLVIGNASIADFAAVILLSLLFTREATSPAAMVVLLAGFVAVVVATGLVAARAGRQHRLAATLQRLQDSSAQIRVRGAVLLLVFFAWLAQQLGLEVILGAFLAGATLRLVDRDRAMTHPNLRAKLEAVGFGFFIPFFFVVSGVRLDVAALLDAPEGLLLVPVLLLALLLVRGVPALLYQPLVSRREAAAGGLLQATTLPFVVAAADIGRELGVVDPPVGAALVVAGLLSVVAFPLLALAVLRRDEAAVHDAGVPERPGVAAR